MLTHQFEAMFDPCKLPNCLANGRWWHTKGMGEGRSGGGVDPVMLAG
jgi:hypothetical protein